MNETKKEPTTEELFATLEDLKQRHTPPARHERFETALAELARRMGAMGNGPARSKMEQWCINYARREPEISACCETFSEMARQEAGRQSLRSVVIYGEALMGATWGAHVWLEVTTASGRFLFDPKNVALVHAGGPGYDGYRMSNWEDMRATQQEEQESAFTDAPPVFTLEEVDNAMTEEGVDLGQRLETCRRLAALRSTGGGR